MEFEFKKKSRMGNEGVFAIGCGMAVRFSALDLAIQWWWQGWNLFQLPMLIVSGLSLDGWKEIKLSPSRRPAGPNHIVTSHQPRLPAWPKSSADPWLLISVCSFRPSLVQFDTRFALVAAGVRRR